MERGIGRRIFSLLAVPSVAFVVVKAMVAWAVLPGPAGRMLGLFGGQPGAGTVLVSGAAALIVILDRVRVDGRVGRMMPALSVLLVLTVVGFARLYLDEYGSVF